MSFIEIFAIALGLAMDAFAVSLSAGGCGRASGHGAAFRLSLSFGFFQFIMPVIGWYGGIHIASIMEPVDHWIAFGLLAFVGIRMIRAGFDHEFESYQSDPSKGWTLLMLSIATSIDALAVGLSIALLGVSIWYPSIVIGIVAAILSLIGLHLGCRLGERFGKRMEVVGGLILIGIGIRILIEHLAL